MKTRTDSYVRAAVHACGRRVGDNEYELTWPKRRIARHLNLSYRTLAYHLNRADVTSLDPLRVSLGEPDGNDVPSAAAVPAVPDAAPSTAGSTGARVSDVLAVVQHAAGVAQDTADLEQRAKIVRTAAALLDAWLSCSPVEPRGRSAPRELDAESREVLREQPRAKSRASQVSQSVSFSSPPKTNNCLTDLGANPVARETQPREMDDLAHQTSRAPTSGDRPVLITEAEALAAVAPLAEQCRRLHLPAIDSDGITMLRSYLVDEIVAARHYVNGRLTTDKVRSPMGLLIHTLKKGTTVPAHPQRARAQPAATSVERCRAPRVLELSDDDVTAYFDVHLRPKQNPLVAEREPPMSVKRALVSEHFHTRTSE